MRDIPWPGCTKLRHKDDTFQLFQPFQPLQPRSSVLCLFTITILLYEDDYRYPFCNMAVVHGESASLGSGNANIPLCYSHVPLFCQGTLMEEPALLTAVLLFVAS